MIIHQAAVKSVEVLRAKITQQISIIGKCEFLDDSQLLNWTNKACFMEEFLGSLGSKKLAIWESSFNESSHLPTYKF
jgi:hypothetical protein